MAKSTFSRYLQKRRGFVEPSFSYHTSQSAIIDLEIEKGWCTNLITIRGLNKRAKGVISETKDFLWIDCEEYETHKIKKTPCVILIITLDSTAMREELRIMFKILKSRLRR